ncbi:MAG: hypothetical protein LBP53_03040 [Candidatus Peribacteria bacterium]|nr:hypothetical protein [Candidatus Peribacteria bacterium]
MESLARFCKTSKETLLEILRSRNITPKENKDTFLCYGYKKYRASVGGTRAKSYTKKKKLREIREPSPKLKAIQIAIKERLMTIPTSFSATAGPKKSAEKNAELHKHHPYLITLDLKDAFPSIKTRRVYENLKAALWRALDIWTPLLQTTDDTTTTENKRLFLRALTHLCVAEDELPQGAPSSPQILNIVMAKVDSEITRKLPECFGHYRTIYSRYVDDLTISFDKYPTKDVLEEKFDTYCRNIQKAQSDPNTLTNIMNQFQNDTFIATDNAERTFIQTKIEELKNIIQQAQISQDKKFTFIGQLNKYKGQIQP